MSNTSRSSLKKISAPVLNGSYGKNVKETFENIDMNFGVLANTELYKGDTGKSLITLSVLWETVLRGGTEEIGGLCYELPSYEEDIRTAFENSGIGGGSSDIDAIISQLINNGQRLTVCSGQPDNVSELGHDQSTPIPITINTIIPYVVIDTRFREIGNDGSELADKTDMSCTISYNGVWKCEQNFPTLYYSDDLYWIINGNKTTIPARGVPGRDGSTGETYVGLSDFEIEEGEDVVHISHLLYPGENEPADVDLEHWPFLTVNDWVKSVDKIPQNGAPIIILSTEELEEGEVAHEIYAISTLLVASNTIGTSCTSHVGNDNKCMAILSDRKIKDYLTNKMIIGSVGSASIFRKNNYSLKNTNTSSSGYSIFARENDNNTELVVAYVDDIENPSIPNNPAVSYSNYKICGSLSEGDGTEVLGENSHAEGVNTSTSVFTLGSHVEGKGSYTRGSFNHAEGVSTSAFSTGSHAEGYNTSAGEHYFANIFSGSYSHAEGWYTKTIGSASHAEGWHTTASGECTHTEGRQAIAAGDCSHAEGEATTASGVCSHAEGYGSVARGDYSHSTGGLTKTTYPYEFAVGKKNETGMMCYFRNQQYTNQGYVILPDIHTPEDVVKYQSVYVIQPKGYTIFSVGGCSINSSTPANAFCITQNITTVGNMINEYNGTSCWMPVLKDLDGTKVYDTVTIYNSVDHTSKEYTIYQPMNI